MKDVGLAHGLFGAVEESAPVKRRFIMPPFSVLDARQGVWKERKKKWLDMGIKSELGRDNVQASLGSAREAQKKYPLSNKPNVAIHCHIEHARKKKARYKRSAIVDGPLKKQLGMDKKSVDGDPDDPESWVISSIFDPVLCELAYRWWCPEAGQVLDPFAGGSVRGIIAGALGLNYWGSDLRTVQIEENRVQLEKLLPGNDRVEWVAGDSGVVVPKQAPACDFVFSCPPYGDLEVYSEEDADISNMDHDDFMLAYRQIIKASCDKLRDNRFACFVVADYRDDKGHYQNFVSKTIKAFKDAGMLYYNEAILVTAVGTASIRVTRQFNAGRKLCKSHQNILTFVKGDWRKATEGLEKLSGGTGELGARG